jgi:uncharacterized protein (UPF0335 family)
MTYPNNTDTETVAPQSLTSAAQEKVRQIVERVEGFEKEKAELTGQIKEVYAEAKALGLDPKALRAAVRLRKVSAQEREEAQMILDLYLLALGEI